MHYDKLFTIKNVADIPEDKTLDDYLNGQIEKAAERHPATGDLACVMSCMWFTDREGHGSVQYW